MHELTTAIKILITGIFFTRSSTNTARTTATVTALVSHICKKFKDHIMTPLTRSEQFSNPATTIQATEPQPQTKTIYIQATEPQPQTQTIYIFLSHNATTTTIGRRKL